MNNDLIIDQQDTFIPDEELVKYEDYTLITADDNSFINSEILPLNIIKFNLFKEEDTYTYVPNYLRSEFS
jgi:hypothetical protein